MQEKVISFKYDGASKSIKNHQIDARLLASALDSFADLISSADTAINQHESNTQVKAQAGFIQGSFGVDLIVYANPDVLEAIGLIAAAGAGSILSILKDLKGRKIETIEVEEDSKIARLITSKGDVIETKSSTAKLIDNMEVRAKLDKLVHQPLTNEGISSFSVFSGHLNDIPNDETPIFEVTDKISTFYKKPNTTQTQVKETRETRAIIEFVAANKHSGTSGWRMNYLNERNISVKIQDETFLKKIKRSDAPGIFSEKFSVDLKTTITKKNKKTVSKTYKITKVIGPKKAK